MVSVFGTLSHVDGVILVDNYERIISSHGRFISFSGTFMTTSFCLAVGLRFGLSCSLLAIWRNLG